MKTPKEKAEELVDKFIIDDVLYITAIKCAKIAVEETIIELNEIYFEILEMDLGNRPNDYIQIKLDYWQEVKNELNKM